MRLVTLDSREVGGRPGISLPSGEILDLAASPSGLAASQWRPHSVVSVIAEGEEGAARVTRLVAEVEKASPEERQQWRDAGRLLPARGTRLMPPIRRPGLLLMVTGMAGEQAVAYVKNPNSALGPDAILSLPEGTDRRLYLLGMVGLVLGRPLFRATADQAARAVAALTLVADLGTQRLDSVPGAPRHAERQFPGACVIGPELVTIDEFSREAAWNLTVRVNGRAVGTPVQTGLDGQRAVAILTTLSQSYGFRPGDVVGLPAGIGEFELPAASPVSLELGTTLKLAFSTGV